MDFKTVFSDAIWIGASDEKAFPILSKGFDCPQIPERAVITVLGFGSFVLYLNGERVGEDYQLPLNSDFEERGYPYNEKTRHRVYCVRYDLKPYLKPGHNALTVLLGNSWYTGAIDEVPFGSKKAVFRIELEGMKDVLSDLSCQWRPSFLTRSTVEWGEDQDFSSWKDEYLAGEGDGWLPVAPAEPLKETTYEFCDCPYDHVKALPFKQVAGSGTDRVYDASINVSGYPVLIAGRAEKIIVTCSEELLPDGTLDPSCMHNQKLVFVADAAGRECFPRFTWLAYRYFRVQGDAKVVEVRKQHTAINVSSSFHSDNETLNWLYHTYLNTQLCNLHTGIPSDCPHLERRGYTGDGQLTCHAAMMTLDMQRFYHKWIRDIADCQDEITGHVQYTAPYTHCGGGPGGWGCAIVEVPYQYWKHYGDDSYLREMYPQMLRYFDYLEAHSEFGLVISDNPSQWCLGDWCTPGPVELPAPFVNNYFYIKSMLRVLEIARVIGRDKAEPETMALLKTRIEDRKRAITAAYLNAWDGNFIGCRQGANAFALDIGLGDERTKQNFIEYYRQNPFYDTGIFGTEIVTRLLFVYGEAEMAIRLMTAASPHGFGRWREIGATTFWEYWQVSRSHNHPMFGAVTAFLFDYLLGIGQEENGAGYSSLRISPAFVPDLNEAEGSVTLPCGTVSVSYRRTASSVKLNIMIPENTPAVLILKGREYPLQAGMQSMEVEE